MCGQMSRGAARLLLTATTQAATARSDSVQHLSAVHQRVFRLQQVGQAVELLEPGIGVMLAVRG